MNTLNSKTIFHKLQNALLIILAIFFATFALTTQAHAIVRDGVSDVPPAPIEDDVSGGGEQECFPAGTKVSLENEIKKNIEDVREGDRVLSQDVNGKKSVSTVQQLLHLGSDNMCEIHFDGGDSLKLTNPHPVYTQNGWKAIDVDAATFHNPGLPIAQLQEGDRVANANGTWQTVTSISCMNGDFKVYNLSVDTNHNFFAGGFLVHNKYVPVDPSISGGSRDNGDPVLGDPTCPNCVWENSGNGQFVKVPIGTKLVWEDQNGTTHCTIAGGGECGGGGAGEGGEPPIVIIPPPGNIQARAVTTTATLETCSQIKAEINYRNNTQFNLFLGTASQGVKTQSGSTYVNWDLDIGTYRLAPLSPGTSSLRVCLTDSTGSHFGQYTATLTGLDTSVFDVAYGPPPAWYQAQGGDVYAGSSIAALTPSGASPRQFVLNGTSGAYPGVVTYGGSPTDYDFNADGSGKGESFVSSKNWLVNDALRSRDFYSYFFSKLGNPSAVTPDMPSPLTQPTYDSTKSFYFLQGDVTTSGDWVVADGQKYIFLIDGNLTINGKINITGNGFITFIVKNNISVDPTVGVAYNSVSPVVEGVYIASGAIHTGVSSTAGAERFVGKGMFVGNDVKLERDLNSVGQNGTYGAELFIYNPGLLVTMPDVLKNVPVSWQEVAP